MNAVPFPRGRPRMPLTCWGLEPQTAGMGQSRQRRSAVLPAVLPPARLPDALLGTAGRLSGCVPTASLGPSHRTQP